MSVFHFLSVAGPPTVLTVTPAITKRDVASPATRALVDAGLAFGISLFSSLVTLSAVQVRVDPFVALYGPFVGAGLIFFYALSKELGRPAVAVPVTVVAPSPAAPVAPPGASP